MGSALSAAWKPVLDLPDDWLELASDELEALLGVWKEQAIHLKESKALREFNERLSREWAIETGILEKLYTLDEGISTMLVEKGLHSSLIPHGTTDQDPDYVIALIRDQHEAVEWLFDFVTSRRELTPSFIKELHQLLTRHQEVTVSEDQFGNRLEVELVSGDWRKLPAGIERLDGQRFACCPAEQLAVEVDTLVEMSRRHRALKVPAEVEAAWLHHRFTQIHPFQDGNGRVARALATIAFLRDGYFPLVVRRGDREEYLQALYYADANDLAPLVRLFAKLEKRAFVEALGISREVLHEKAGLAEILAAATDRLKERVQERERRMAEVFRYADMLFEAAKMQVTNIATLVNSELVKVDKRLKAWCDSAAINSKKDDYFHYQVIEAAKRYRYFANTRTYRAWVRLVIKTQSQTELLLAFHCVGPEFRGVMVCSALTYRRERAGEDTSPLVSDVDILSDTPFQFNYNDHKDVLVTRFGKWVDQVVAVGLDRWRRSL